MGSRCVFPLTSLQIGDLQSYLSHLNLFLAHESNKIYILVDNRPWLKDLISRPTHLWQLMVTKTDTSLAIEAKLMRRWEFDSVSQAARCIHLWFPGTDTEQSILGEYLNTIGEVFYDAEENILRTSDIDGSVATVDDICAKDESPSSSNTSFSLYPETIENNPFCTPPAAGPYKRRKVLKSCIRSDLFSEESFCETIGSPIHSQSNYSSESEDVVEATGYKDILILFRFNDCDLPFKLKDIIMSDLRLLTLLETGLPSWAIFLQSYPGFSRLYRPWMCPLARFLYVIISVITVLIGFYDLYKNVPLLKATASHLFGPLFDWIETWEMISRIKYLGTMLFLHNFEKAVKWFLMMTRPVQSFLSFLTTPMAGPLLGFLDFLLPFWNMCTELVGSSFSIIWMTLETSCSLVGEFVEILFLPFWFLLSVIWNIEVESTVTSYEVSMWRSLWNDIFSQIFRAVRSIFNVLVAALTACNRHRLRLHLAALIIMYKGLFKDYVGLVRVSAPKTIVTVDKYLWLKGCWMMRKSISTDGNSERTDRLRLRPRRQASYLPPFPATFSLLSAPLLAVLLHQRDLETGKAINANYGGSVGVNYGRIANNLPSAVKVVALLKSQGLDRVKVYDTDPAVLKAFSGSGIKITVNLPNERLYYAAKRPSFAQWWVRRNVAAYHPATQIEAIAVGNEVFVDTHNTTKFLVPAMRNIHQALVKLKLDDVIKVSSPVALSALQSSYPSSAGAFRSELVEPVIKPMLDFLRQTGSYLMVNCYPFFAYESNADVIPLDYALFRENPGVVDAGNGLKYFNLFDAQIDAVFAAMSALKYDDIKMVVTETGWPSKGDSKEVGAGVENAAAYNGNLVRRVLTGGGTPLRPHEELTVYLFALFNENKKIGPSSERNFGLFYPNGKKVYDIPLTTQGLKGYHDRKSPAAGGHILSKSARGKTWCVANGKAGKEKLQAGLDFACGEGGVDCRSIQPGSTCYNPNTLEAHASFAFNSYYQKKGGGISACNFGGAAYIVSHQPKFGKCELPH
nr:glucan endo-1,3-beta-glucosidase 12-like [Ipomoea batatas]